jgi:hypothetical protein
MVTDSPHSVSESEALQRDYVTRQYHMHMVEALVAERKKLEEQLETLRSVEEYIASWIPDAFLPDQPERRASVWQGRGEWIRAAFSNPASTPLPKQLSAATQSDGSSPASESGAKRCPVCEGIDWPGLLHNPDAPYCSEHRDPLGYIELDERGNCPHGVHKGLGCKTCDPASRQDA